MNVRLGPTIVVLLAVLVVACSGLVGIVGWASPESFRGFRARYCTHVGVPLSKWSPWVQATASF